MTHYAISMEINSEDVIDIDAVRSNLQTFAEGFLACSNHGSHVQTVIGGIPTSREAWKPYPAYPEYEVSTYGRVRSLARLGKDGRKIASREIKPTATRGGYLVVRMHGAAGRSGNLFLHRVVLEAFVGPAPENKMYALHGNGKPHDNRLENLRWGSQVENCADKLLHGTQVRGEDHYYSKLSEEDVRAIKADDRAIRDISSAYAVTPWHVRKIKRGMLWRHVQ